MNRMKLAQECVEIDEAGGNVLDFLRMRGCISPWGTWYRLQIEELGRNKGQITEGKGGNDMKRVTLEQKKKAVEIALGGGDPLAYLKSIGSKQPPALWYAIRKGLLEADPAAYEKLMGVKKEKLGDNQQADPETVARLYAGMDLIRKEMKEDTEEPKPATCCAPSTRKGVEVPDEIPDAPKTLDGSAWEKYAVPAEEARPGIGADVKQAIRAEAPEEKPKVQLTVKAEDLKAVMDAPDELPEEKPKVQLTAKVVPVKLEEVKDLLDAPVTDAEEKPKPGIVSTLKYDRDGNLRMEVGRPLDQLGIKIYGLTAPAGDFQTAGGMLAWYKDGNIIANRKIEDWKHLMETLPVVMEIMNI